MFLNLSAYVRSPPRKKGVSAQDIMCDLNSEVKKVDSCAIDTKRIQELISNPALANVDFVPPGTRPVEHSITDVKENDVLCGRGGGVNGLVGNRRYRNVITMYQLVYLKTERKAKPLVARVIVETIRKRGGRFLKKDENTGMIFEIGDDRAESKTSQALRDGIDATTNGNATLKLKRYVTKRMENNYAQYMKSSDPKILKDAYCNQPLHGRNTKTIVTTDSGLLGHGKQNSRPFSPLRDVLDSTGTYPAQITPLSSLDNLEDGSDFEEDSDFEPVPYTPRRKKDFNNKHSRSPHQKVLSPLSASLQSTLQNVLFHTPFRRPESLKNNGVQYLKCSPIVSPDKKRTKRWSEKKLSPFRNRKLDEERNVPCDTTLNMFDDETQSVCDATDYDINDPLGFYDDDTDMIGFDETSGVWYC
mmetsp:Transcript_35641/g.42958  ORF Transcript_35641/g.42958 Transcript_35641/m.42958 type:complete len:416 (+) Transcript_35641:90-1337(+)